MSAPRAAADAATLAAADTARPSELPRLRVASASGARLEFRNETPGETRLEILDLAGRRIAARELGWIAAGPQRVTLPALGGLRSGIYFVRITRADRVSVARLVVLE